MLTNFKDKIMPYILEQGSSGQEVRRFQPIVGTKHDGSYGPATKKALVEYQKDNGLVPDGIYGPASQRSMGTEVFPGVDVSAHQGIIDWPTVAKTQKFAIVKLTEGRTHKNPRRIENYSGAKKAGMTVGAYHFAKPETDKGPNDAEAEAQSFLTQLSVVGWERGVDFAPFLDIEAGLEDDDQYNVDWIHKFCERIQSELKVTPTVYTGRWFYDSFMRKASKESLEALKKYRIWWADYVHPISEDPDLRVWTEWHIRQWTGTGDVAGIKGDCDRNWLCGGNAGLNALKGI